jgi:hypothetical protein
VPNTTKNPTDHLAKDVLNCTAEGFRLRQWDMPASVFVAKQTLDQVAGSVSICTEKRPQLTNEQPARLTGANRWARAAPRHPQSVGPRIPWFVRISPFENRRLRFTNSIDGTKQTHRLRSITKLLKLEVTDLRI